MKPCKKVANFREFHTRYHRQANRKTDSKERKKIDMDRQKGQTDSTALFHFIE